MFTKKKILLLSLFLFIHFNILGQFYDSISKFCTDEKYLCDDFHSVSNTGFTTSDAERTLVTNNQAACTNVDPNDILSTGWIRLLSKKNVDKQILLNLYTSNYQTLQNPFLMLIFSAASEACHNDMNNLTFVSCHTGTNTLSFTPEPNTYYFVMINHMAGNEENFNFKSFNTVSASVLQLSMHPNISCFSNTNTLHLVVSNTSTESDFSPVPTYSISKEFEEHISPADSNHDDESYCRLDNTSELNTITLQNSGVELSRGSSTRFDHTFRRYPGKYLFTLTQETNKCYTNRKKIASLDHELKKIAICIDKIEDNHCESNIPTTWAASAKQLPLKSKTGGLNIVRWIWEFKDGQKNTLHTIENTKTLYSDEVTYTFPENAEKPYYINVSVETSECGISQDGDQEILTYKIEPQFSIPEKLCSGEKLVIGIDNYGTLSPNSPTPTVSIGATSSISESATHTGSNIYFPILQEGEHSIPIEIKDDSNCTSTSTIQLNMLESISFLLEATPKAKKNCNNENIYKKGEKVNLLVTIPYTGEDHTSFKVNSDEITTINEEFDLPVNSRDYTKAYSFTLEETTEIYFSTANEVILPITAQLSTCLKDSTMKFNLGGYEELSFENKEITTCLDTDIKIKVNGGTGEYIWSSTITTDNSIINKKYTQKSAILNLNYNAPTLETITVLDNVATTCSPAFISIKAENLLGKYSHKLLPYEGESGCSVSTGYPINGTAEFTYSFEGENTVPIEVNIFTENNNVNYKKTIEASQTTTGTVSIFIDKSNKKLFFSLKPVDTSSVIICDKKEEINIPIVTGNIKLDKEQATICLGNEVILEASGASNYQWEIEQPDGNILILNQNSNSFTFTPTKIGTYTIKVKEDPFTNCLNIAIATIHVKKNITTKFNYSIEEPTTKNCRGEGYYIGNSVTLQYDIEENQEDLLLSIKAPLNEIDIQEKISSSQESFSKKTNVFIKNGNNEITITLEKQGVETGCKLIKKEILPAIAKGALNIQTKNNQFCLNEPIEFTAEGSQSGKYKWSRIDVATNENIQTYSNTSNKHTVTFKEIGTYRILVEADPKQNCEDEYTMDFFISNTIQPILKVQNQIPSVVCPGQINTDNPLVIELENAKEIEEKKGNITWESVNSKITTTEKNKITIDSLSTGKNLFIVNVTFGQCNIKDTVSFFVTGKLFSFNFEKTNDVPLKKDCEDKMSYLKGDVLTYDFTISELVSDVELQILPSNSAPIIKKIEKENEASTLSLTYTIDNENAFIEVKSKPLDTNLELCPFEQKIEIPVTKSNVENSVKINVDKIIGCKNTDISLSATNSQNDIYIWERINNNGEVVETLSGTTPTITLNFPDAGTYQIVARDPSVEKECFSSSNIAVVIVNDAQKANILSEGIENGILCSNSYSNQYPLEVELKNYVFQDGDKVEWISSTLSSTEVKYKKLYLSDIPQGTHTIYATITSVCGNISASTTINSVLSPKITMEGIVGEQEITNCNTKGFKENSKIYYSYKIEKDNREIGKEYKFDIPIKSTKKEESNELFEETIEMTTNSDGVLGQIETYYSDSPSCRTKEKISVTINNDFVEQSIVLDDLQASNTACIEKSDEICVNVVSSKGAPSFYWTSNTLEINNANDACLYIDDLTEKIEVSLKIIDDICTKNINFEVIPYKTPTITVETLTTPTNNNCNDSPIFCNGDKVKILVKTEAEKHNTQIEIPSELIDDIFTEHRLFEKEIEFILKDKSQVGTVTVSMDNGCKWKKPIEVPIGIEGEFSLEPLFETQRNDCLVKEMGYLSISSTCKDIKYDWSDSPSFSLIEGNKNEATITINFSNKPSGDYTFAVKLSNDNGCSHIFNKTIYYNNELPNKITTADDRIGYCTFELPQNDLILNIDVKNENNTYDWSVTSLQNQIFFDTNGKTNGNQIKILIPVNTPEGIYPILCKVTHPNGCGVVLEYPLTVIQEKKLTLIMPEDICTSRDVKFAASGALSNNYLWSLLDPISKIKVKQFEENTQTLTTSFEDSEIFIIKVEDKSGFRCLIPNEQEFTIPICSLDVANVFTPNNDEFNPSFKIPEIKGKQWRLQIFNRWGKQVIEMKNYQNDWKAEKIESGLYFYLLTSPKQTHNYQGWVNIIK